MRLVRESKKEVNPGVNICKPKENIGGTHPGTHLHSELFSRSVDTWFAERLLKDYRKPAESLLTQPLYWLREYASYAIWSITLYEEQLTEIKSKPQPSELVIHISA